MVRRAGAQGADDAGPVCRSEGPVRSDPRGSPAAMMDVLDGMELRPRGRTSAPSRRSSPAYCQAKYAIGVAQRHRRADAGAARLRRRPRRRGDHRRAHLHRHRRGDRQLGATRSTWTSTRETYTLDPAELRGGAHGPHPRASCRSTSTARWPTWTRSCRSPRRTAWRWSRTPARRTAPTTRAGARAASATRRPSASTRRRTSAPTATAARSTTNSRAVAELCGCLRDHGSVAQVRAPGDGLELAPGRAPGGGAAGQAALPRRVERPRAGARRATYAELLGDLRPDRSRRARRTRATSTTSTSSRPSGRDFGAASAGRPRHRHRRPLPDADPPAAGLAGSRRGSRATCAVTERSRRASSRCRCTPRWRPPS